LDTPCFGHIHEAQYEEGGKGFGELLCAYLMLGRTCMGFNMRKGKGCGELLCAYLMLGLRVLNPS